MKYLNFLILGSLISLIGTSSSCINVENTEKPNHPNIKQEISHSQSKSTPYKAAFAINICKINSPEEAEDVGYYLMIVEDALKKIGVHTQYLSDDLDLRKIPIKSDDGTLIKTIDLSSVVNNDNCVGYLVAKDGAEHKFIELDPIKTEQQVVEYFK